MITSPAAFRWASAVSALTAILVVGCVDGADRPGDDRSVFVPERSALIYGTVHDLVGAPVAGARVEILTAEGQFATTDATGAFAIELAVGPPTHRVVISRDGFVTAYASAELGTANQAEVTLSLSSVGRTGGFDVAQGMTAEIEHAGARVWLPSDGLAYADGTLVAGPVEYRLTRVPVEHLFRAERHDLVTAVDIEFRSAGELVNLAPGHTAMIELPVQGDSLPSELSAMYFDPELFTWVVEGRGPVLTTSDGAVWQAEIAHFSSHGGGGKVTICHIPPGNQGNAHTISVGSSAVDAHLAHGDGMGGCPGYLPSDPDGGNDPDCFCAILDLDADADDVPIAAGQDLSEAYASWGVHLSTGDELPISYDSSAPTGGDMDLGTPNEANGGPGIGAGGGSNVYDLGNLLIVAEDLVDADADGLVDDPDNAGAGTITVSFDNPTCVHTAEFVDVDGRDTWVYLYDDLGSQIGGRITIGKGGNNSYRLGDLNTCGVSSVLVSLRDDGAVNDIGFCTGINGGVCEDSGTVGFDSGCGAIERYGTGPVFNYACGHVIVHSSGCVYNWEDALVQNYNEGCVYNTSTGDAVNGDSQDGAGSGFVYNYGSGRAYNYAEDGYIVNYAGSYVDNTGNGSVIEMGSGKVYNNSEALVIVGDDCDSEVTVIGNCNVYFAGASCPVTSHAVVEGGDCVGGTICVGSVDGCDSSGASMSDVCHVLPDSSTETTYVSLSMLQAHLDHGDTEGPCPGDPPTDPVASGEPECTPARELCDGVDNDCDGEIDEGDLCGLGGVCLDGGCVPT